MFCDLHNLCQIRRQHRDKKLEVTLILKPLILTSSEFKSNLSLPVIWFIWGATREVPTCRLIVTLHTAVASSRQYELQTEECQASNQSLWIQCSPVDPFHEIQI